MVKKMLNSMLWFYIMLFGGTLVITIFNYFDIMGGSVLSIMRFIIPMIAMFISSYRLGKVSDKKGYLEGLKFGGIVVLMFMIIVMVLDKLSWKSILYYLILLLMGVMGSMIGINRKKTN